MINLLQTTYLDPGIVSAESSLCATIHWGYTCVFWFVHTRTRFNKKTERITCPSFSILHKRCLRIAMFRKSLLGRCPLPFHSAAIAQKLSGSPFPRPHFSGPALPEPRCVWLAFTILLPFYLVSTLMGSACGLPPNVIAAACAQRAIAEKYEIRLLQELTWRIMQVCL